VKIIESQDGSLFTIGENIIFFLREREGMHYVKARHIADPDGEKGGVVLGTYVCKDIAKTHVSQILFWLERTDENRAFEMQPSADLYFIGKGDDWVAHIGAVDYRIVPDKNGYLASTFNYKTKESIEHGHYDNLGPAQRALTHVWRQTLVSQTQEISS
jgi:hypothetical protein